MGMRESWSKNGKLFDRVLDRRFLGRGDISRFIKGLVRPDEVTMDELEAEYRAAAEDTVAEKEALDWLEASVDEALD